MSFMWHRFQSYERETASHVMEFALGDPYKVERNVRWLEIAGGDPDSAQVIRDGYQSNRRYST